ncbi:hypothetical protein N3K66_001099 [Trichothecium roseum]|uniref:Uncharacterized protein n=1 Tax=Trichothecium roseum TaxID=47278 RepID=A0ACC0VDS0_9HYPO|nr:hypothetical protein N3K66_001099 [Trichothecium roseum]
MTFKAQVLYPNEADTTFDMDYYIQTHMPLVEKSWKPYGLEKWEVVKYHDFSAGAGEQAKATYAVAAFLTWKDKESASKAFGGPEASGVFGDIPNFCNKQPLLVAGDLVSSN